MSYTYVEGGWTQVQINDDFLDDPKGDGGYIRGSFAIAPQVHVFGGYSTVSKSYSAAGARLKVDLAQPELGIGYHMNMSERVDFTADIAAVRVNAKVKISCRASTVPARITPPPDAPPSASAASPRPAPRRG
jgi:hypothetical protein